MKKTAQRTIGNFKYKVKIKTRYGVLAGWNLYVNDEKIGFNNGVGLPFKSRYSADDMLNYLIENHFGPEE